MHKAYRVKASEQQSSCSQRLDRRPRNSILIALISRQVWPAAATETAPPLLWFATIQRVEGKQDLADLTPKNGFVAAEPIQSEVGQISETQKATREVGGGIDGFRLGARHGIRSSGNSVRGSIRVGIGWVSPREHRVDYLS